MQPTAHMSSTSIRNTDELRPSNSRLQFAAELHPRLSSPTRPHPDVRAPSSASDAAPAPAPLRALRARPPPACELRLRLSSPARLTPSSELRAPPPTFQRGEAHPGVRAPSSASDFPVRRIPTAAGPAQHRLDVIFGLQPRLNDPAPAGLDFVVKPIRGWTIPASAGLMFRCLQRIEAKQERIEKRSGAKQSRSEAITASSEAMAPSEAITASSEAMEAPSEASSQTHRSSPFRMTTNCNTLPYSPKGEQEETTKDDIPSPKSVT